MRLIDADEYDRELQIEQMKREEGSLGQRIFEANRIDLANRPTVPAVPLDKLCALLAENADCPPEHSPVQDHCKENCAECWESVLKEWIEEYDCENRERKQRQ